MWGSMHGECGVNEASCSDNDDPYGLELDVDCSSSEAQARQQQRRLEEQAAYICQLEETNLKLQERVYLLEQGLRDAQRAGNKGVGRTPESGASSGHSSEDEDACSSGQSQQ